MKVMNVFGIMSDRTVANYERISEVTKTNLTRPLMELMEDDSILPYQNGDGKILFQIDDIKAIGNVIIEPLLEKITIDPPLKHMAKGETINLDDIVRITSFMSDGSDPPEYRPSDLMYFCENNPIIDLNDREVYAKEEGYRFITIKLKKDCDMYDTIKIVVTAPKLIGLTFTDPDRIPTGSGGGSDGSSGGGDGSSGGSGGSDGGGSDGSGSDGGDGGSGGDGSGSGGDGSDGGSGSGGNSGDSGLGGNIYLEPGSSKPMIIGGQLSDGTVIGLPPGSSPSYGISSSNPASGSGDVISISPGGYITGLNPGSATVTVSLGDYTGEVTYVVPEEIKPGIGVSIPSNVELGEPLQVGVTIPDDWQGGIIGGYWEIVDPSTGCVIESGYGYYGQTVPGGSYNGISYGTIKPEPWIPSGPGNYQLNQYVEYSGSTGGSSITVGSQSFQVVITPLELWVEYDITRFTRNNVTATLRANKPITVLNNNGNREIVFSEDGQFTFHARDTRHGEEGYATAKVDWIREPIQLSIKYHPDNYAIRPDTVVAELICDSENIVILNNSGNSTYEFDFNHCTTFKVRDRILNETYEIDACVGWIYDPLSIRIEYDNEGFTASPVTATVVANREFEVVNNDGDINYIFEENGTFTFICKDPVTDEIIHVDASYFDIVEPLDLKIEYTSYSDTHPDDPETNPVRVEAKLVSNRKIRIDNNDGDDTVSFDWNGEFTFYIRDYILGDHHEVTATVDWFLPELDYSVSYSERQNKHLHLPVTAYVVAYRDGVEVAKFSRNVEVMNNEGSRSYRFDDNGVFTFECKDKIKGTVKQVEAEVTCMMVPSDDVSVEDILIANGFGSVNTSDIHVVSDKSNFENLPPFTLECACSIVSVKVAHGDKPENRVTKWDGGHHVVHTGRNLYLRTEINMGMGSISNYRQPRKGDFDIISVYASGNYDDSDLNRKIGETVWGPVYFLGNATRGSFLVNVTCNCPGPHQGNLITRSVRSHYTSNGPNARPHIILIRYDEDPIKFVNRTREDMENAIAFLNGTPNPALTNEMSYRLLEPEERTIGNPAPPWPQVTTYLVGVEFEKNGETVHLMEVIERNIWGSILNKWVVGVGSQTLKLYSLSQMKPMGIYNPEIHSLDGGPGEYDSSTGTIDGRPVDSIYYSSFRFEIIYREWSPLDPMTQTNRVERYFGTEEFYKEAFEVLTD